MRRNEIEDDLSKIAFEFFYRFSRFEFCLKENSYLKNKQPGFSAEPGWKCFVVKHAEAYALSAEAEALLASPPEQQIVADNLELAWQPISFEKCTSDLDKVVKSVKTVRNNLFHGGKHGAAGWDDPVRARLLIEMSTAVLAVLAVLGDFTDDYERFY